MDRTKNDPSLFVEEKIVYQEKEILNEQKIIPQDFVELTTHRKNYMCSTESWKEPICERYGFTYGAKWIQLDIPQRLMEKLDLKTGENCPELVFISLEVLSREPEKGGITLQSEREIFFFSPGDKLFREKGVQTKLYGESIRGLEKRLEREVEELKKLNEILKVENSEKGLKIKELEEEMRKRLREAEKLKQKVELYKVEFKKSKKVWEEVEGEMRSKVGSDGIAKMKERANKRIERREKEQKQRQENLEAKMEVPSSNK